MILLILLSRLLLILLLIECLLYLIHLLLYHSLSLIEYDYYLESLLIAVLTSSRKESKKFNV